MDGIYAFGPYRLHPATRVLTRERLEVAMGSRAFDMLVALVLHSGEVVSRRQLIAFAWHGLSVEESNVRVQIAHLRRELGCGVDGMRYIISIPGRGYCFVAPVERILDGQPALPATGAPDSVRADVSPRRATRLPLPHVQAFGRSENVAELSRAITARRFVSVVGPGGVGKTTLAVLVAHALDSSSKAVYFVDLSCIEKASLVATAVATALGLSRTSDDIKPDLLAFLAEEPALLILDNCEHVIDEVTALVDFILGHTDDAHILVTSREALRLQGEAIYLLRPLASPPHTGRLTASQALVWPAVALFMEHAFDGGHHQPLGDDHASAVAAICRRLDGNPLAIQVVASRVGTYGLEMVSNLLTDQLALSWRGSRDAAPRHQTVEAMLDWSYNLLSELNRKVLRRLSVFVGDFSMDAAAAVAGDDETSAAEIAKSISDLIDKSLIAPHAAEGPVQFRLLDITRTYAAMKLAASDDGRQARLRHADFYRRQLKTYAPDSTTAREGRKDGYPEQDIRNLRIALDWAFSEDGEAELATEICALAVPVFLDLFMLSECRQWCGRALGALPDRLRDTPLELALQEGFAISACFTAVAEDEVRRALERGLDLGRRQQSLRHQFHLMAGLNLLMLKSGEFRRALDMAERYAAEAIMRGSPCELRVASWMLGIAHHYVGDQNAAETNYVDSSAHHFNPGAVGLGYFETNHHLMASVVQARVAWMRGQPGRSIRLALKAIEDARSHPASLCICLLLGIPVFLLCGQFERAERLIDELQHVTKLYSFGGYNGAVTALRGELLLLRDKTDQAIDILRGDTLTGPPTALHLSSTDALRVLAESLALSGDPEEAISTIDAALERGESGGGSFNLANLLRTKAEILLVLPEPDIDGADDLLIRAIEVARVQSALGYELRALLTLARLREMQGREIEVIGPLKTVVDRFNDGFETSDLKRARQILKSHRRSISRHGNAGDEFAGNYRV